MMDKISNSIRKIVESRIFKNSIISFIALSAVIMGAETYPGIRESHRSLLGMLDKLIIAVFCIEIVLKILANGRKPWIYFKDPWNVFDFIIVAVCLVPAGDMHFFAVFRILRVLRLLRMITIFPKLRLIVSALLKSIPSMGYVIMLLSLLFYLYGVTGVFVFGTSDPVHFADLHHSLVTLFKVLTLEGWTDIMDQHIFSYAEGSKQQIIALWPFFYFASFILLGAMIIMNLFIGVIMKSMEESQAELSGELKKAGNAGVRTEEQYRQLVAKVDELSLMIRNMAKTADGERE